MLQHGRVTQGGGELRCVVTHWDVSVVVRVPVTCGCNVCVAPAGLGELVGAPKVCRRKLCDRGDGRLPFRTTTSELSAAQTATAQASRRSHIPGPPRSVGTANANRTSHLRLVTDD